MSVFNPKSAQRTGLIYSVGLHLAVILLLMLSTQQNKITPPKGIAIQAEIMDLDAYMKSIKKTSQEKPKPEKKQIQQPKPEPKKAEPKKAEPKKTEPKKPEPKKTEPVIKKPAEKPPIKKPVVDTTKRNEKTERQKKLEEIRRKRQAAEAEVKTQPEIEQPEVKSNSEQTETNTPPVGRPDGSDDPKTKLLGQYMVAIQSAVTRQWSRPSGTRAGLNCQIKVNQIPGGGVIDVSIGSPCNASAVVRNSIINAVKKADPLPYSGFEEVFERRLNFIFQYQGD